MKLLFRRIHLYLGLVSGLFIVFVCLTGTILVFEKEIEQSWHSERYFVTPVSTPRLSLAQLADAVHAYKPNAKIGGLKVYADPTRSVEVSLAGAPGAGGGSGARPGGEGQMGAAGERRGGEGGRGNAGQPGEGGPGKGGKGKGDGGGPRVFVNPYTGAILGEMNPRESFFHTVEQLHRGLVAGRIGKLVMGINASIFLFILGTGLVLWWPAARKALASRLTVKWGQRLEAPQPRFPPRAGLLRFAVSVHHGQYGRGHVLRLGRAGHQPAHPLAHEAAGAARFGRASRGWHRTLRRRCRAGPGPPASPRCGII